MLALPGWVGMSIFLFFEMGVWGFESLCWLFLHTNFKPDFYWIFVAHLLAGTMGFLFIDFRQRLVFGGFYLNLHTSQPRGTRRPAPVVLMDIVIQP